MKHAIPHDVRKKQNYAHRFFIITHDCTADLGSKTYINETPTVRGLAADNNNKLYIETMIFLWNKHYNLNFIM